MFLKKMHEYGKGLCNYSPFPPGRNREAWGSLNPAFAHTLIQKGEAALKAPWPTLTASDYLDFTRTGRRTLFQDKYFARRHLLNDFVMAECAAYSGKYIEAIICAIFSICEESGWQLPAHNSYMRSMPQIPMPNPWRPVPDLFACETAASLSLARYLLEEHLERAAPGINARILSELKHRVIVPYLTQSPWWTGENNEPTNNWTVWCTQNILLTCALMPMESDDRHAIGIKAAKSLDAFLAGYGEDGCCDEGAKYYSHAALCLFVATDLLINMTGGHFADVFGCEKIRNIADFIRYMHVAGDYYINFADCPPVLDRPGALLYRFGCATRNADLMAFAANGTRKRGFVSNDLSLHTRLTELFFAEEAAAYAKEPKAPADVYFESAGMFVVRDAHICLAVKAGGNNDNHNHNDTGSIILYINGKPLIIDVGVGSYTKDTFSENRYSIWTMQSEYHNLPTFGGIMQAHGAEYAAKGVNVELGSAECSISMDIAGAYPAEAGVERYMRKVTLKKGHGVFILDDYRGRHSAELSLMFCARPTISGRTISVGDIGNIITEGAADVFVREIPITDPLLLDVWPSVLFCVNIVFLRTLGLVVSANQT